MPGGGGRISGTEKATASTRGKKECRQRPACVEGLVGCAWKAVDKAEIRSLEDLEHCAWEMRLHDERLLKVSEEGVEVRSKILKGSCRCVCAGWAAEVEQSASGQVGPGWKSWSGEGWEQWHQE